jgi:hypothetical protein
MKSYNIYFMKYLKRYKIFESNTNESYFELVDILQSKIFDDFDIIKYF